MNENSKSRALKLAIDFGLLETFNAAESSGLREQLLSDFFDKEIERYQDSDSTEITIAHQNVQCMSNKIEDIEVFLETNRCDIVGITEHWFTDDSIKFACIDEYYLVDYYGSENHIHGGTALICRQGVHGNPIEGVKGLPIDLHFECAAGRFLFGNTKVIVMVVYRSSCIKDKVIFSAKLSDALDILGKYSDHRIIVSGDFNYDFPEPHQNLNTLLDLLNSHNIYHVIKELTRQNHSLDNICIQGDQSECSSKVIYNRISDHSAQLLQLITNS